MQAKYKYQSTSTNKFFFSIIRTSGIVKIWNYSKVPLTQESTMIRVLNSYGRSQWRKKTISFSLKYFSKTCSLTINCLAQQICDIWPKFIFKTRRNKGKKLLWAPRLWVCRRWKLTLGYISKIVGKQNSGSRELRPRLKKVWIATKWN